MAVSQIGSSEDTTEKAVAAPLYGRARRGSPWLPRDPEPARRNEPSRPQREATVGSAGDACHTRQATPSTQVHAQTLAQIQYERIVLAQAAERG